MMAFPVYNNASWSFNNDAISLRKMLNWGITDRMEKIRVSPGSDLLLTSGNFILDQQPGGTRAWNNANNSYIFRHEQRLLYAEETANIGVKDNGTDIFTAQQHSESNLIRPSSTSRRSMYSSAF